jgi:phospholipid/cholesterol/gamma-HCH transport system ATP-binding protein
MMNPRRAAGIDGLIRKMQSTFNLTSIVVTHELASVQLIADTVCMLKSGEIVGLGTMDTLRASDHPFVRQFFERRPDPEGGDNAEYIRSLTGAD